MVRISKDPEERRSEILDAAQELFMAQGFEETSVTDIVKKIGVAQGTFYYYFESKDAVLSAVLDRFIVYLESEFQKVTGNPEMTAKQKFQALLDFESMFSFFMGSEALAGYIHREDNIGLHQRFMDRFFAVLIPLLTGVVRQGVAEGSFDTPYPLETIEILLMGIGGFIHQYYFGDTQVYTDKKRAMDNIVERLLGAFSIRTK